MYLDLRLLVVDLVLQVLVLLLAAGQLDLDVAKALLELVNLGLSDLDRLPGLVLEGLLRRQQAASLVAVALR